MGDPKKQKKKYDTPSHPWQKARIDSERVIVEEYGIKNKTELWKASSQLRHFKEQAKKYASATGAHADMQKQLFLKKLVTLGLIKDSGATDDILSLELKDILNRRLQTIVVKKKLAATAKQARQFIVHNHIAISGRKLNVPGYIVRKAEEDKIEFSQKSSLAKEDNPERVAIANRKEKPKRERPQRRERRRR